MSLHHYLHGIHCPSTFAKSSQFLLVAVIWKLTSFGEPFSPPSNPPVNAPWLFCIGKVLIIHFIIDSLDRSTSWLWFWTFHATNMQKATTIAPSAVKKTARLIKYVSGCYIRQSSSSAPFEQSMSPSHVHACRAHSPFPQVNRSSGQGSTAGSVYWTYTLQMSLIVTN